MFQIKEKDVIMVIIIYINQVIFYVGYSLSNFFAI